MRGRAGSSPFSRTVPKRQLPIVITSPGDLGNKAIQSIVKFLDKRCLCTNRLILKLEEHGDQNMGIPSLSGNFEIAPGVRVKDWSGLILDDVKFDTPDWQKAFAIFDARYRSRFIEPAQLLIDSEDDKSRGTSGFAVLAIDFMLIETIQGFKSGYTNHTGKSKDLFKAFLSEWPAFIACVPHNKSNNDLAVNVYEQGRCALHHTGSTDRLVVGRKGELFVFHQDGRIEINRSGLHSELTKEFNSYLEDLKSAPNGKLRKNFKVKMTHICS